MSEIIPSKMTAVSSKKGTLFVVRPHTSYLDGPAVARWLTKNRGIIFHRTFQTMVEVLDEG